MEYKEAWQIAGLIVDMLHEKGIETISASLQEEMAYIIEDHSGLTWSEFKQEWSE